MEYETISGDEVAAVMRGEKISHRPDDDLPKGEVGSAVPLKAPAAVIVRQVARVRWSRGRLDAPMR